MKVPFEYIDKNVCMIGLGYVGLTLAVVMAEAGYQVCGVEKNPDIVKVINQGRAHFMEVGLDPRLHRQVSEGRLVVKNGLDDVPEVSAYIVTVGTPLRENSKSTDLNAIESVARGISKRLRRGDLVILRSTVRIGVSREIVKPILDAAGVDYSIAFCPERTLEGKALQELVSLPQIIGADDAHSTLRAAQLFSFLTPTIVKMSSLEAAEMVKLVNNTQRDLMFAFANEIAGYADAIGINAREVINSANMGYARSTLAAPGPVGGPCLEKDPYILAEGIRSKNGVASLALLGRQVNERLIERAVSFLSERMLATHPVAQLKKVSILGLAFKGRPETNDLRGTLAIPLIRALRDHFPGCEFVGYDPACKKDELASLDIAIASDEAVAFENADLVIFQNNNLTFQKYDLAMLASLMKRGGLIYDFWMQVENYGSRLANNVVYGGLGSQFVYAGNEDA